MRPLELRIRNFRSYFGDDTVIDFRDRGLVGVVGPIGSGKSSLLDAIAFALFGRTPTVAASTKSLIHQRADGATVNLRFSVDDEVWEVTRAMRRKGQSVHGLVRLADDSAEPEKLETHVLESAVNERIVELLGLEFDGFSRSIMLAQGRFAEFLRARPAERDKVLKGVFGYDRVDVMRTEAKIRAAAEATRVETLGARLEAADALAGRIAAGKELLAKDEARLELLRKAEAKFADYKERLESTSRVISHTQTRIGELEPLAAQLPVPEVVAEIVRISKGAVETRGRLGEALGAAQSDLAAADADLVKLDPKATRSRIEEMTRLETINDQLREQEKTASALRASQEATLAEVARRLEKSQGDLESATSTHAAVDAELAELTEAQNTAAAALHAAEHQNMAGTLRGRLESGAPCPVCDQPVATIPSPMVNPETDEAAAEVSTVAAAIESVRGRLNEAANAVGKLRETVAAGQAESKSLAKEIAATTKQLTEFQEAAAEGAETLQNLSDGETAAELRGNVDKAEAAVAEARKKSDLARAEHDEAIRAETAAGKELATLRLTLAELATRLDLEIESTDDIDAVTVAVRRVREAWSATMETLATAQTAAEHDRSEVTAAQRKLQTDLDFDGEFEVHLAETVATIDVRHQQIAGEEATLAESDEVRAARDSADAQHRLYESLASELTDSKFVRYLLDEEKRALAGLGSEHFERLSSGRYRFSDDGGFNIVDLTSADAIRKADSLSGGETFLASLALALALAEMVARTGGRLDAFFLDEGFGSLDPEHLDLAMEGIEQLAAGASDRLVLVVSHVPDMRHRMEDLIELDRNPVTGDTVLVHG